MSDLLLHIGFRVSGRPSWQHETVLDDFELLAAARDCARLLDGSGWVDVRLHALQEDLPLAERFEIEIDWREATA